MIAPLFQSTPPARGATSQPNHPHSSSTISIHAPREGGDEKRGCATACHRDFNPRPPRGGRLRQLHHQRAAGLSDFNPRPPRGGRRLPGAAQHVGQSISIHAPREGGDPAFHPCQAPHCTISIHAPREGGDPFDIYRFSCYMHFNPRPPRGGRLFIVGHLVAQLDISIHAPREGGDERGTMA